MNWVTDGIPERGKYHHTNEDGVLRNADVRTATDVELLVRGTAQAESAVNVGSST